MNDLPGLENRPCELCGVSFMAFTRERRIVCDACLDVIREWAKRRRKKRSLVNGPVPEAAKWLERYRRNDRRWRVALAYHGGEDNPGYENVARLYEDEWGWWEDVTRRCESRPVTRLGGRQSAAP